MLPVALQKEQPPQPTVTNSNATNNPLQLKQPANNPLQLPKVVQRQPVKIEGDRYVDSKTKVKLTRTEDGAFRIEEGINKGLFVYYDNTDDFYFVEDEAGIPQLIIHNLTEKGTVPKNELNRKAELVENEDGIDVSVDQGIGVVAGGTEVVIHTQDVIGCAVVIFENHGACFMAHILDRYNEYRDNKKAVAQEINSWINHEASYFKSIAGRIDRVIIMYDTQTPGPEEWMKWLTPGGYKVNWIRGNKIERRVAATRRQPKRWLSTLGT